MQREVKFSLVFRDMWQSASSHAIRRCDVTVTRLLSDGRCLITSGEVNPGDLVVASGVHHVKEGEQVEPLLPATETNVGGLL